MSNKKAYSLLVDLTLLLFVNSITQTHNDVRLFRYLAILFSILADDVSNDAELGYQNALTTKLKVLKSNRISRLHSVILGILAFFVIILCASVACLMIEQQKLGPYKEGKEHLHQNMLQA